MHTISRRRSLVAVIFLTIAAQAVAQPTLDAIASHFPFREIGPTRQGGRVVAFGVTAGDPYRFFVGAGPGGLWRTINNGTSFEPVFDREGAASIGDVAVAPSRPEVVWVGTGEANLRNSTYYGNGVYRSTDDGETWTHRGLEETHHIGRVRIHPRDPDIVYIAAQGHLYSENEERGVYKTVDGGETWQLARLIHEIPVAASPGLPRADWGMVRRRPRSDEEKTAWDKRQGYLSADVEFFDYYDTVEVPGSPEDEADRWGRSLETRVHQNPGVTDRDWAYYRVTPGTYRVALVVGGETVATQPIVISKDHWYDR